MFPDFEDMIRDSNFTFKKFCSFGRIDKNCTNAAVGDIGVNTDNGTITLPICEDHLRQVWEQPLDNTSTDGV